MPKSRGSNSVGSLGSNGTGQAINGGADLPSGGSPAELAGRIADRLAAAGAITVPVESATRGGVENVTVNFQEDGTANVESGSGQTYVVDHDQESCNCINHRTRGGRCRHITAVQRAIGQVVNSDPNSSGGSSLNTGRAADLQSRTDANNEIQRENIINIAVDDGYFYSDNEEEFTSALDRAQHEQIEYEYENALNGSNITFGLEIEFVGGNPDAIARELHRLGISGYDHRVGYHSPSVPGKWKLERDGSVSSGSQGGELVSPVLRDTPETWQQIETICEVAKRHGARIDHRCGGHVHVGMDPLDTARQRWKRFFRLIAGFEEEIYRVSGGTEGRIRSGYSSYARPFRGRAATGVNQRFSMESEEDVNGLCTNISNRDRYHAINLTNIYQADKPNTVEFRYFNSSLDPRQLQANIKLANGIITAAEKARSRVGEDGVEVSETLLRRGNMLREQPANPHPSNDHSGIKKLVDIIFARKKDKDDLLRIYTKNEWA